MSKSNKQNWDLVIKPVSGFSLSSLRQLVRYKDLLFLFVKRDIVAVYKQTILGPLWFFLQPFLSALMFTFIFSYIARITTNNIPPILFYLGGLTLWNYFADCVIKTSETFIQNQHIFGKVYFPRLVLPVSFILSSLLKLSIQLVVFLAFWAYYYLNGSYSIDPNEYIILSPLLVFLLAGLSLGLGLMFSSLTTRYRDIRFVLQFGIQLMMYGSSVVIPLSQVPDRYQWLMQINPVVPIIEAFKFGFFGQGVFHPIWLLYSFIVVILMCLIGVFMFSKAEKTFIDTI